MAGVLRIVGRVVARGVFGRDWLVLARSLARMSCARGVFFSWALRAGCGECARARGVGRETMGAGG